MKLLSYGFLSMALACILLFSAQAFACSCNQTPNPPCSSYSTTPLIFSGEVTEYTENEDNQQGWENRRVKFKVEHTYRGAQQTERVIHTGDGDSDCGYRFQMGKKYLVYAYGKDDYFATNYCSRTRSIEKAKEDLEYFASLPSLKGASIYGSVKKYASSYGPDDFNKRDDLGMTEPLFGIQINISGQRSATLITDKTGNFSLSNLPEGEYSITPVLPKSFNFSLHSRSGNGAEVYVFDKGCSESKFYVDFNGQISGRVVNSTGAPASGVSVQLISADYIFKDDKDTARLLDHEYTDENGEYTIDGIPPGRYFLGIGIGGAPEYYGKNGRIFYPNVLESAKAQIFTITDGSKLKQKNFRLLTAEVK